MAELASQLDLPEVAPPPPHPVRKSIERTWSGLWPKVGAILLTLIVWQLVVWSGWRPQSALPGPWPVLNRLASDLSHLDFYAGMGVTLRRAALGYAIAAAAAIVVAAANQTSIGQLLQSAGKLLDMQQLLAIMIVIFVIGIAIDSLFSDLDRLVRRRWGLLGSEA